MNGSHDTARIHSTALVEQGVAVGPRTRIAEHVHVGAPGTIGHDCVIGEKTSIAGGVAVGNFTQIGAHVCICAGISIADRVLIGAGVIFTNERSPRAFVPATTRAGMSQPASEPLTSTVRTGATLGAGALIGAGLEIGPYALVGMGSVVVGDVPPHGLVYGSPARLRGYVCICGVFLLPTKKPNGSPERRPATLACARCGRRYRATTGPGDRRFLTSVSR